MSTAPTPRPRHRLRTAAAGLALAGTALLLPAAGLLPTAASAATRGPDGITTPTTAPPPPTVPGGFTTRPTTPPPPTGPGGFTTRPPDLPDLSVTVEDLDEADEIGSGALHLSEPLDQDLFVTVNLIFVDTGPWDWACSVYGGFGCDGFVDVTIPAGATEAEFELLAAVDDSAEPTEQFGVTLSVWDTDVVDVGDDAFASLYDGDGIELAVADAEVVEGDAGDSPALTFLVTSSAAALVPIDVAFTTSIVGFGAEPGVDHLPLDTVVTIPAGATEVVVEVEVIGDDEVEDDELLFASISDPTIGSIDLSDATSLGRILDDDAHPGAGSWLPAPRITTQG